MRTIDKAISILIISVPQLVALYNNLEWQYNLIILLVTLAIIFILKWEQLGELFFTKDGFGFKLRENVDELKTDIELMKKMNKPLFIGFINDKCRSREYDFKTIEMILDHFSSFYSEDSEINDLLKKYKNQLIKKVYQGFAREDNFKEDQSSVDIKRNATVLAQEWIISHPEGRSPLAPVLPGEAYIRSQEEAFDLRDKMIETNDLFEKYGI